MTHESLHTGYLRKIENKMSDYDLLELWDSDLPSVEGRFGAVKTVADLARHLSLTTSRRLEASRRERAMTDEGDEVAQSFAQYKRVWRNLRTRGVVLAILLRAQGLNTVGISLRDPSPEEIKETLAFDQEPSQRLLVSLYPQPGEKPFHCRVALVDMEKIIPQERIRQLIGTPDPWPTDARQ